MRTKAAESYPRPLNGLLAAAATEAMRPHRDRRHISASDICRCGTLRVGEASHPGPAVFFFPGRGTTGQRSHPGLAAATLG